MTWNRGDSYLKEDKIGMFVSRDNANFLAGSERDGMLRVRRLPWVLSRSQSGEHKKVGASPRSEFWEKALGSTIRRDTIEFHAGPRDVVRLPVQGRPARH
jgi:hypothetical protein